MFRVNSILFVVPSVLTPALNELNQNFGRRLLTQNLGSLGRCG